MTKENENNLLSYFVVDVWPTSGVFRFHMSDSVALNAKFISEKST